MTRVTADRDLSASPETVRRLLERDHCELVRAAGFDTVESHGQTITFGRSLGFSTLELTVELDPDADAVVAFDAVDGIFESMRTEYHVAEATSGSRVTAWTTFTLGGALGAVLDGSLVAAQRRREFEAQFDYLESNLDETKPLA